MQNRRGKRARGLATLPIWAALLVSGAAGNVAWAAIGVASLTSGNYSQNFNTIGNSATADLTSTAPGWGFTSSGISATNSVYSTAFTATQFALSSGNPSNTGGRFNWGNSVTAADRAIGVMGGSSYSFSAIVFGFKNETGSTINSITLSYEFERYRRNNSSVSMLFSSSVDGTTWSPLDAGGIVGGVFPSTTAVNDYNPSGTPSSSNNGVVTRTPTLSNLNLANGSSFYLQWHVTTAQNTSAQGLGFDNFSLTATLAAASTTYNLSASATPIRLTTGRTTTFTGSITNAGTGSADTLNYSGLGLSATNGSLGSFSPSSGGPLAQGAVGSGTTTFTAGARGVATISTTVTSATNATLNSAATAGTSTSDTILIDALAEHTSVYSGSDASDYSTAKYRDGNGGGADLGIVTVIKTGTGDYLPGYKDNLGGVLAGTLEVNMVGGAFPPDASVVLIDFANVTAGSASTILAGLEAALLASEISGLSYVDRFGNGTAADAPLDILSSASRDYDLLLRFASSASGMTTYFDFDFAGFSELGGVNNLAVVPEPAIGIGGIALWALMGGRRRRERQK